MSAKKAIYRRLQTSINEDAWFTQLTPSARALFFLLITVVGTSGARVASTEWLARKLGYDRLWMPMWMAKRMVRRSLKQLGDKVCYWPNEEVVWVKNFVRHQGSGEKFITGAVKHAHNFPEEIAKTIVSYVKQEKPIKSTAGHTLSENKNGVSDTSCHTVADTHARAGAHLTEEQSNRVTEDNIRTHSLNACAREINFIIEEFRKMFPESVKVSTDPPFMENIEKAVVKHDRDYWLKMFAKAKQSDFLTARKAGSGREPFRLNLLWLLDNSEKVLAGYYDRYKTDEPKTGGVF